MFTQHVSISAKLEVGFGCQYFDVYRDITGFQMSYQLYQKEAIKFVKFIYINMENTAQFVFLSIYEKSNILLI